MAGVINTLPARLALIVGGVQLALLPFFYLELNRVVSDGAKEQFVNDVRSYARFLADTLEAQLHDLEKQQIRTFLDNIALSQETVFAEWQSSETVIRSEFSVPLETQPSEDFEFGDNSDDIYVIRIPVFGDSEMPSSLTLAFDERPTLEILENIRQRIFVTALIFFLISIILAMGLAYILARPLRRLRRESQRIAQDQSSERFCVSSGVPEIRELAEDLEAMRVSLVEANNRLSDEIESHEKSERARKELENTLRHVDKLETIGTLAGGIAHEINNALQPIRLYAELALDSLADQSTARKDLRRILDSVGRAKKIVEQVLTFSRRSQDDAFENFNVAAVVSDALTFARDLFSATTEITYSAEDDDLVVCGSSMQIHQLVMNLCSNAHASLPASGGRIDVTVARKFISESDMKTNEAPAAGEYIEVAISDNGHGMDPRTMERIFEPFFTTRQPGQGTGLGMAVAHGIAKAHAGFIRVQSSLGEGSTLRVYLPMANTKLEVS